MRCPNGATPPLRSTPATSPPPAPGPTRTRRSPAGATANFASGNIHVGSGGTGGMIKAWVERIYIWLIVVVIGGMLVHNGFDYFRKMQALYRRRRAVSYTHLRAHETRHDLV